jgi:hypothetical protein
LIEAPQPSQIFWPRGSFDIDVSSYRLIPYHRKNPLVLLSIISAQSLFHITILHHFNMKAAWLLLACLGAVNAASGVVEVDLVFPRNDTYAPSSTFPIIFAFQNPGLAPFLNLGLFVSIRNLDDVAMMQGEKSPDFDIKSANFSSNDTYYELRVLNFSKEGTWIVIWDIGWDSCTQDSLVKVYDEPIRTNITSRWMVFTTKASGKQVDLVAATTNRNCSENEGVAISIAATLSVPYNVDWEYNNGNGTCASMASTTPAPTPCQVKFDSIAASSMSSSITSRDCAATRRPGDSCPFDKDKSAAEKLTGGAAVGMAGVFGALGYLVL